MTATTVEAVQQTLAEYERIARDTGEWNGGEPVEFSDDGQLWTIAWLPTEDHAFPVLAKVSVFRREDTRPTTVVVRWDEALPADEEWRALWLRKPTALFGAFTYRAALRRAFRDVIGDRREPDEVIDGPTTPTTPAPSERNWLAELAAIDTEDGVRQLHYSAKLARAVTAKLELEMRKRLLALKEAAKAAPSAPRPKLAEGGIVKSGRLVTEPEGVEKTVQLSMPKPKQRTAAVTVTPADIASAIAKLSPPTAAVPRGKGARRPQKPKPRGPRD